MDCLAVEHGGEDQTVGLVDGQVFEGMDDEIDSPVEQRPLQFPGEEAGFGQGVEGARAVDITACLDNHQLGLEVQEFEDQRGDVPSLPEGEVRTARADSDHRFTASRNVSRTAGECCQATSRRPRSGTRTRR